MRNLSGLALLLCLSLQINAATNITTPTVSGHWTMAGSPYRIFNTITIGTGQSLLIDPGVSVVFQGPYEIDVWGVLRVTGGLGSEVTFDIQDTTGWSIDTTNAHCGGWLGIVYAPYSSTTPDTSYIGFCNFHHLKNGAIVANRNLHIEYSGFNDNLGPIIRLQGTITTGMSELNNCEFFDNYSKNGPVLSVNLSSSCYVHDNNFYNIRIGSLGGAVACINSTILFSYNNVHHNFTDVLMLPGEDIRLLDFESQSTGTCRAVLSGNNVYENVGVLTAPVNLSYAIGDLYGNYICNNHALSTAVCAHTFGGGGLFLVGCGDYGDVFFPNRNSLYTVRNNVIANNHTALYGGGISVFGAKALIANNTIVNNRAPRGGGIDLWMPDTATVCIKNNILWGNICGTSTDSNVNITIFDNFNLKFDHNWMSSPFYRDVPVNVVFGYPNAALNLLSDTISNVIGTSPGFVNPTLSASYTVSALASDFSVIASSACINTGTDSAVMPGTVDYAGNSRIYGTAVDIGAHEYGASSASAGPVAPQDTIFKKCCGTIIRYDHPIVMVNQINNGKSMTVYPNPASNIMFITTPEAKGAIELYNVTGAKSAQKTVTTSLTFFDIHTLPRGIYFAVWEHDGVSDAQKVIVE